jgi:hypothetical protein
VAKGGLAAAGLYNAAMLVGVVLSAPATAWLAGRMPGRTLLTTTAAVEVVLRVGTLAALLAGWPAPVIAAGVVVMNVAAWAGFAGMRAEVADADGRPAAMTRYATCIAAIEAAGAGLAALLPVNAGLVAVVAAVYGASLVPTFVCACRAQVPTARQSRSPRPRHRGADLRGPVGVLAAGALIMLLASGPTRLAVALADQLHGQVSVAGATAAFSAGCLLASTAVDLVDRIRLPTVLAWPLWGVGMLVGWVAAPLSFIGLLAAQFLSGLSLTAFEGAMDARMAKDADRGEVTAVLAWSASIRALGGAVSVRLLPVLAAAPAIGVFSGASAAVLAAAGVIIWAAARAMHRGYRQPFAHRQG